MALDSRITPDTLAAHRSADNVMLVDVRTPAEFETARIPGSVNIPLNMIEKHPNEIGAELHGDIVLVCRSGARAGRAEKHLAAAGVTHTSVLEGGIEAWRGGDREVQTGEPRWDLERQVRLVAGSIVLTSIVASVWAPKARFVAGFIGAGLTFAAATNTCAMGMMLSKLPYNRQSDPSLGKVRRELRG